MVSGFQHIAIPTHQQIDLIHHLFNRAGWESGARIGADTIAWFERKGVWRLHVAALPAHRDCEASREYEVLKKLQRLISDASRDAVPSAMKQSC